MPLVGAVVAHAIARPGRSRLPARLVDIGACASAALLTFVGVLGVAHQLGWLLGDSDQHPAAALFELYVVAGAFVFVPFAVRHLRRPAASRPSRAI